MKVLTFTTPLFVATIAMTGLLLPDADAKRRYVARIPNGGNVTNTPAIGHPDGTGVNRPTNAFGDHFHNAGNAWTVGLCQMDSDGDGQTNGQELGDPCCLWNQTTYPVVLWTIGVTHPSDANKTSDPKLWANVDCAWQAANKTRAVNGTTVPTITFPANTTPAPTNITTNATATPEVTIPVVKACPY